MTKPNQKQRTTPEGAVLSWLQMFAVRIAIAIVLLFLGTPAITLLGKTMILIALYLAFKPCYYIFTKIDLHKNGEFANGKVEECLPLSNNSIKIRYHFKIPQHTIHSSDIVPGNEITKGITKGYTIGIFYKKHQPNKNCISQFLYEETYPCVVKKIDPPKKQAPKKT